MTNEIKKNAAAEMTADEMNQEYAITWTNEITKNENMNDAAANTWAKYTEFENITQRAKKLTALTRIVHAGIVHEMEQIEPDATEIEGVFDELDRLNQTLTDDIAKLEQEYLKAARADVTRTDQ